MPEYREVSTPSCYFCRFYDHNTDFCKILGVMVDPDYCCSRGRRLLVKEDADGSEK